MAASLILGQSYDCLGASEATLTDMGKLDWCKNTKTLNKLPTAYMII